MKKLITDITPSLVVFLVALPLCMGVAIASGVPAEKGLITGIIGGIVVGSLAGSPLQVTGPAAGLIVIVWEIVQKFGIEGLGIAVFIAGLLQVVSGVLGFAHLFRAVCPAVIRGMLSGIGVIIVATQFHIMIDDAPKETVLKNLLTIPEAIIKIFDPIQSVNNTYASVIGVLTIATIYLWDRFKPKYLKMLPGALVGVGLATITVFITKFPISFISIPDNLVSSIFDLPWLGLDYSGFLNYSFLGLVLALALVASAEALLCAVAVDKLHNEERTNYNKELIAQGVGNTICGIFAALPLTGVIVRSSANIDSGAKSRYSSILQGVWLILIVALFPLALKLIPTSSLAALLVFIGFKLINLKEILNIKKEDKAEFITLIITIFSIVVFDLLTGILIGLGVAIFQLAVKMSYLDIKLEHKDKEYFMSLYGTATFLKLHILAKKLESLPADAKLHVFLSHLNYIDKACFELFIDWEDKHKSKGGKVFIEWDELHKTNLMPKDKISNLKSE